jgi:tyrosinase
MTFIRRNVYEVGGDWAGPILWYARGVAAMQKRALADVTSWRFYGGIHGFYKPYWEAYGYLTSSDKMPSQPDLDRYWDQCQHSTWYFPPWHRGYLITFEKIVRAAIVQAGGPADWALPYWNYFKKEQNRLPPAFASKDWPDGKGNNPLFVDARFGPNNDGNVYVPLDSINLNAMGEPVYTGVASGGSPGFGGVDTGFNHGGGTFGRLESQPHNIVHVKVGGANPAPPKLPGLMSTPPLAGLDPIFWLHHANIDRLWEAWIKNPPTHSDPTILKWLNGPGFIGQRIFSMPLPNGAPWNFTPRDVNDLSKLDYSYDTLVPGAAVKLAADRLKLLGVSPSVVESQQGVSAMTNGNNVELVGANRGSLQLVGSEAETSVELDPGVRQKVSSSLNLAAKAVAADAAAPDRVFLNLENIRGIADATAFQVYINLPQGEDPAAHPELLAGTVGLFGVREASLIDEKHAGQGLTVALEITDIVDRLHLNNALDADKLNIRIFPANPVAKEDNITIGRFSIFRHGQ